MKTCQSGIYYPLLDARAYGSAHYARRRAKYYCPRTAARASRKHTKCKGIACPSARRKGECPLNPRWMSAQRLASVILKCQSTQFSAGSCHVSEYRFPAFLPDLRGQAPYSLPPKIHQATPLKQVMFSDLPTPPKKLSSA